MLKRINEQMNVRLTLDEANRINGLLDRDEAKAVIHKVTEKYGEYDLCPSCEEILIDDAIFCYHCGQRLDRTNYQL